MSQYRRLAPWDEIGYFQTPKYTTIQLSTSVSWAPILTQNANRVAVIFSATGTVQISSDNSISLSGGVVLTSNAPSISFTEAEFGPLPSQPWYAATNLSGPWLTVCEIILQTWPEGAS